MGFQRGAAGPRRMPMQSRAARLNSKRDASRSSHLPLLWLLSLAAIAGFAVLVTVHAGNGPGWTAFEDVSETLAAVTAALACASRARRDRREDSLDGGSGQRPWRAW